MKKNSKILFLLLALVAIVTAFTVVALAAEEATEKAEPVVLEFAGPNTGESTKVFDFTDHPTQDVFRYGKAATQWKIYTDPDSGNQYLLNEYNSAASATQERLDINLQDMATFSMGKIDTTPYGVNEYPIFAFDFDFMSPTSPYAVAKDDAYIQVRIYNNKSVAGNTKTINFTDLGLSEAPYKWQHVTVAVIYEGNAKFSARYYVNGEERTNIAQIGFDLSTTLGSTESKVRANLIFIGSLKQSADTNKLCMDNLQFSYYPTGYTADEVANYVYNDSYKLPYGRTVASIIENGVETKYDNFEEAFALANENNTLKLYADATYGYYHIAKAINVETGGFDFNWVSDDHVVESQEGTLLKFVPGIPESEGVLVDTNGTKTEFNDYDGFEAAAQHAYDNAASGISYRIILYKDIEYYKAFSFTNKQYFNLTIDLNGHKLTRVNLYGTVHNYDSTTGTKESQIDAFDLTSAGDAETFKIVSSSDRGAFRTVSVDGEIYYNADGRLDYYTANKVYAATFITAYPATDLTVELENIDLYSENLLIITGDNTINTKINVSNCNFYKTQGSDNTGDYAQDGEPYNRGFIHFNTAETGIYQCELNFRDSKFYFPASTINNHHNYTLMTVDDSNHVGSPEIVFDNCDIISEVDGNRFGIYVNNKGTVTFNNCRTYNLFQYEQSFSKVFLGDGNLTDSKTLALAEIPDGYTSVDKAENLPYYLPKSTKVTFDETSGLNFDFEFIDRPDIIFDKMVVLESEAATVQWLDMSGNVVAITKALKGDKATAPSGVSIPAGDKYTAYTNPAWLNANGEADLTVKGDGATFKASTPENPELVAYVIPTLGYNYYGKFNALIYLPVTENIEIDEIDGFDRISFEVTIDGTKYWAYTSIDDNTTIGVSQDSRYNVSFTKDGTLYEDEIIISAIRYADAALNSSANGTEKTAVANMVRLLKEARLAKGYDVDAKFDELIALGGLDVQLPDKEEYADSSVDYSELSGFISSISFKVDRTFAAYVITPSDPNAVVTVTYADDAENKPLSLITSGDAKLTDKTRVYDLDRAIRITVTTADGTVSGTYSARAYIYNTDNALAKAMYEFGMAVKAYREAFVENQ